MSRCRRLVKVRGVLCSAGLWALLYAVSAHGAALDESGDIKLGLRTYASVRVGTQDTDIQIIEGVPGRVTFQSLTFPVSSAGHMRQNRYFVEATLDHSLTRLYKEGFGPLKLLHNLPFRVKKLSYFIAYRGDFDTIYDLGPSEYRTSKQWRNEDIVSPGPFCDPDVPPSNATGMCVSELIGGKRQRLRRVASARNRLFQAYVQARVGKLFFRLGRQILVWGETDAFRLLDNINPLDASFGGFLIPLDERRVPLDMLRLNYYFGRIPGTPVYEAFFEAFAVIDNEVGFDPGVPNGSPWTLPGLGAPSASTFTTTKLPASNFKDMRGGFQFKFNAPVPGLGDATFGIANYWTYLDNPAVQVRVGANPPGEVGGPFPFFMTGGPAARYVAWAEQSAPLVRITGVTSTFALRPEWVRPVGITGEPIVRLELAYFSGEPRFSQSQLDPFIFALTDGVLACPDERRSADGFCTGGLRTGDSWNFVIGIDTNQWIRFLNENATFFITTQFFFKHLRGAVPRRALETPKDPAPGLGPVYDGEVLPVPAIVEAPDRWGFAIAAAEPIYVHRPVNQYLQTLLIGTSYFSGQLFPSLTLFYDWSGTITAIPQVTLFHDPFRFTMSYSYVYAGRLKGASGTSLMRDRDNVLFQIEYVL